jgi:hypothetical protein
LTLHIHYNHQYPKCEAYYIPFDNAVPCPNCGLVEEERFDFVPKAAGSIMFNLHEYGSYAPDGWGVSSLGDHILLILFGVFESFRLSRRSDFEVFTKERLSKAEYGDQKYLEKHIYEIAVRVYEEMQSRK